MQRNGYNFTVFLRWTRFLIWLDKNSDRLWVATVSRPRPDFREILGQVTWSIYLININNRGVFVRFWRTSESAILSRKGMDFYRSNKPSRGALCGWRCILRGWCTPDEGQIVYHIILGLAKLNECWNHLRIFRRNTLYLIGTICWDNRNYVGITEVPTILYSETMHWF
jgi:hypothetical protein